MGWQVPRRSLRHGGWGHGRCSPDDGRQKKVTRAGHLLSESVTREGETLYIGPDGPVLRATKRDIYMLQTIHIAHLMGPCKLEGSGQSYRRGGELA